MSHKSPLRPQPSKLICIGVAVVFEQVVGSCAKKIYLFLCVPPVLQFLPFAGVSSMFSDVSADHGWTPRGLTVPIISFSCVVNYMKSFRLIDLSEGC